METFSLPMREIGERFTKSELYMIAWRSQEQHHHLMEKTKKWDKNKRDGKGEHNYSEAGSRYGAGDIIPEGVPDHFYNKDGEIDLSQVTGKEAYKYMATLGMQFPVMRTGKTNPSFTQGK